MLVGSCSSGFEELVNSGEQVGDVAEAASLFAVAVDGDGFADERLVEKIGESAAVIQTHARAVGIKDADNAGVEAVVAVIGHGHGFGVAFGFVVNAARADRIHVAPVTFGLRADLRIAVTFGSGGEEIRSFFGERQAQGIVRAERADFQSLNRVFQVIGRTGGRSEMQDDVDRAGDFDVTRDILAREAEFRMRERWAMLESLPVTRLSRQRTSQSFSSSSSQRCEPRKPAPPVITARTWMLLYCNARW